MDRKLGHAMIEQQLGGLIDRVTFPDTSGIHGYGSGEFNLRFRSIDQHELGADAFECFADRVFVRHLSGAAGEAPRIG